MPYKLYDSDSRHFSILISIFLLVVSCMLAGCSDGQEGAKSPPPPNIPCLTLEPRDIPLAVELPGRAVAVNVSEVRPQVSGIILKRLFTEGTDVEKGQQLYQIDPAIYEANYQTAVAGRKRAEANVENARLLADRYSKIVQSNAVSKQEYDNAMANYRVAQAELASARAAVNAAKINLDYTRVFSPVSGRIGISSVTEGALVTAGQGAPLAHVQQMDPVYIDVVQSSTEYLKLQRNIRSGLVTPGELGQIPVQLLLEDGKKYNIEARLKLYDVSVDQSTGSITLRAEVANPDRLILPGMFIRATVNEGTLKGGLLVPQQAVQRNQKGLPYVLVVNEENKIEFRSFSTENGTYDNSWTVAPGLYTQEGASLDTAEALVEARKAGKTVMGLVPGERIVMEGSLMGLTSGRVVNPTEYIPYVRKTPAEIQAGVEEGLRRQEENLEE